MSSAMHILIPHRSVAHMYTFQHTYIHTYIHAYIHSYIQVHVEVKISVDDVPFLFHDDILDRTTNAEVDHISSPIAL